MPDVTSPANGRTTHAAFLAGAGSISPPSPGADPGWRNRAHFFGVASQLMRHVLVDYARERLRLKRGRATVHIPIDAGVVLSPQQVEQIIAVDLALQRLAKADERKREWNFAPA